MTIVAGLNIGGGGRRCRILQVNEIPVQVEIALQVESRKSRLDETGIITIGYNVSRGLVKALQASIHSGAMLHVRPHTW